MRYALARLGIPGPTYYAGGVDEQHWTEDVSAARTFPSMGEAERERALLGLAPDEVQMYPVQDGG